MSFHNKPNYQIPELIEALKAHRLPHDTPSQLADSFRIGWMACRELAQAPYTAVAPAKSCDCSQGQVCQVCDPILPVQADNVLEDAARWHWMAEYIVGTRTDLDDELIASATVDELRKLVDTDLAARKQGATQ